MPVRNAQVAAVFDEIADLLDIEGGNVFRVRAYRNAARMLSELGTSVQALLARHENLDDLPGIGPDLAAKIAEVVNTGSCRLLDELRRKTPPAVCELLRLPGLGPRRVKRLVDALGVQSLADLHQAAQDGRVDAVPGFGPRQQQRILDAATARLAKPQRMRRIDALPIADELTRLLNTCPGVQRTMAAGSLRRGRDTVGDLDLLVTADAGSPVMQRFVQHPEVREILAQGDTRASVVRHDGLQVDLRVVPPQSFGAAAVYFTGSKAHNIALRRLAQDAGLKVNEYGVHRGAERVAGDTEESVYACVGLPWIAPELREDRGELEAAHQRRLPVLVQRADLQGDLHSHTKESDGHDTLQAMAEAARARGLRYLAITEHSRRLTVAHGVDPIRLAKQIDLIDRLNDSLQGITLLKGVEADILEDGRLDLPESILARLDLVVGAVHHRFDLPRARQTTRLLRAMDQRCFSILAHPSGRLIDSREPMEFDLLKVLRHARERGCFMELNSHPARLDLDELACQMARSEGVLVSIASDAHSTLEFDNLDHGVTQARRGWLEARDVLNTRPLPELRRLLRATMA